MFQEITNQGNRDLTENSQRFHIFRDSLQHSLPNSRFCGLSNKIPDGRFIILSTGRLLLAPQRVCMWSSTVSFTEFSAEQG